MYPQISTESSLAQPLRFVLAPPPPLSLSLSRCLKRKCDGITPDRLTLKLHLVNALSLGHYDTAMWNLILVLAWANRVEVCESASPFTHRVARHPHHDVAMAYLFRALLCVRVRVRVRVCVCVCVCVCVWPALVLRHLTVVLGVLLA